MKKVLLIMAAALMTMTQCRKQETVPATPSANTIKMTVTAGSGAKTDINTETGAITWSEDDKLYVSDGTSWLGSLDLDSGAGTPQGTFKGTIQGIGDGTATCHFFYLGHDNGMEEPTSTNNAVISFASQDGTDEGAFKYHLGHGKAVVTVSEGAATGAVSMRTEIAMAHLKLKMNDADYTGSVTMDVSNTMTVRPDGDFRGSGNGITIAGTSGDRYVTLIPTEETSVSFSGSATGSLTFGHGIQANNLYGMKNGIEVTLTATHEYVNLGLSVKWATCNLGASTPEGYGDYYQWGGTTAVTSTDINVGWENCPGNEGSSDYNATAFNTWKAANLTGDVLNSGVDAATANWGGSWRMPTGAEFQELIDNTDISWTKENGVYGLKCVSKKEGYTDKYIFLPAAGYRDGTILSDEGSPGNYWSSSLSTGSPDKGCYLNFGSYFYSMSDGNRYGGISVRPVCPPQN